MGSNLTPLAASAGSLTPNTGGQQSDRIFSTAVSITDSKIQNPLVLIDAELTLGFQGSVTTVLTSPNTAKVTGILGQVIVATGTTLASGFAFGSMGKLTINGACSTANFVCGMLAQLDLSQCTSLTSTNVYGLWVDMGATMSAAAITGEAGISALYITNTAPGSVINAAIKVDALATYLIDASNASYSPFFNNHVPTTLSGSFTVNTSAGVRYIALYTTE